MMHFSLALRCMVAVGLLLLCHSEAVHLAKRLGTDLYNGCLYTKVTCGFDPCATYTCPTGKKCNICFDCNPFCV